MGSQGQGGREPSSSPTNSPPLPSPPLHCSSALSAPRYSPISFKFIHTRELSPIPSVARGSPATYRNMTAAAACKGSTLAFESILMQSNKESSFRKLLSPIPTPPPPPDEFPPGQFDVWSSIQAQKKAKQNDVEHPYVHPLVRRSSSLLSQESLEICTESLGSETGSDDYFSSDDGMDFFSGPTKQEHQQSKQAETCRKQPTSVNYHCSVGRKSSLPRSFPPPLPSLSCRDGLCLQMRPHRREGRLIVEAVSIPSQNYLHAERQNGRLLLSFVNTAAPDASADDQLKTEQQEQEHDLQAEEIVEQEEEAEEEEEEQVEVVDRGTVVEVKVSTQPQQNSTIKVHRSSIVINKFVSCVPMATNHDDVYENSHEDPPTITKSATTVKTTTTTAAAAAVAASSVSTTSAYEGGHSSTADNKLLFTSKRRNREELLHDMRRCSELRKPLFIWEPCCIATSS